MLNIYELMVIFVLINIDIEKNYSDISIAEKFEKLYHNVGGHVKYRVYKPVYIDTDTKYALNQYIY